MIARATLAALFLAAAAASAVGAARASATSFDPVASLSAVRQRDAADARDHEPDVAALLDGVGSIASPGVPGPLAVTGEDAFVVWTARDPVGAFVPLAAAARHGRGKLVALGHTGYFEEGALATGDTARFVANAARWVGGFEPRVACWRRPALADALRDADVRATLLRKRDWTTDLARYDVVCLDPSPLDAGEVEQLRAWVADGGGLVLVGLGWGWSQRNPGRELSRDHPGNRLIAPLGVAWADGTVAEVDGAPPSAARRRGADAGATLRALASDPRGPAPTANGGLSVADGAILSAAARAVPADDARFLPALEAWLAGADTRPPTRDAPLDADDVADRLALVVQHRRAGSRAPEDVAAAPTAADFPGAVPGSAARRPGARVAVVGVTGERVTTGLYAPPGEVVALRVPEPLRDAGMRVRIGAHSDRLWHRPAWERHPEISATWTLDAAEVRVASPHGGALYLELARDADGSHEVRVDGCVTAPRYDLGRTTADEWRVLRRAPAPWAELGSRHVRLSVPSEFVRGIDDPAPLLELWDRVIEACAELDGAPPPARPERIVPDVDISAGYMHAGYPVMTHLDAAPWLVDLPRLAGEDGPRVWGLWHELGHNRQHPDWTFDGTVEVTCNLYTLYVLDRVSGVTPAEHPRIAPLADRARAHRDAGADFEAWKRDPFLALAMYVELQQAFGWEAYREVFRRYRALPDDARPADDDAKRDLWLSTWSAVVERDLGPFFTSWGVPVSDAALAAAAAWPEWTR